jgi:hypothetical protein
MLRIKVIMHVDGTLEVSGPLVALPALVTQERHTHAVLSLQKILRARVRGTRRRLFLRSAAETG